MGLYSEKKEACTMLDKFTETNSFGGVVEHYKDGAKFEAAIVYNNSLEAKVAAVQGVTGLYTVVTGKNVNLKYPQVFRREKSGTYLQITSKGEDDETPSGAGLQMRQVSAEDFKL